MQNQKIFGSEGGFTNCTNAWIEGGGLSDILKESAARGDREGFFYNCYLRINGVEDKLTYANELYQFYLELKNRKRQIVVVNGSIPNPTTDEIMKIRRTHYTGAEQMIADGVDTFVEIGPGRTLEGFLRKINRNVKVFHISQWEDVDKVCEELADGGNRMEES